MCKFIVNIKEILGNFSKIKAHLKPKTKICVVVKANAYGFGAEKICSLFKGSADYFAVARLSEFLKIKGLITKPCLILSPLSEKESKIAIKNNAEITISQSSNLELIDKYAKKLGVKAKVHLKVDTGMNRYGFKSRSEILRVLKQIKKLENIELVGVYSHLYDVQNPALVEKQRKKFIDVKSMVYEMGLTPIFHLSASKGYKDEKNQFDMVRIGLDLYLNDDPTHKLVANILEIKEVKKGETISYLGTYKAKKDMRIAICSAGYADGVNRLLSNKGQVLINSCFCNIVGKICMDCFMAELTTDAKIGDEVIIFGKSGSSRISIWQVASLCDTIAYEILTGISTRVKRYYRWNYAGYCRKILGKETCQR